jgi:hypothetical protein
MILCWVNTVTDVAFMDADGNGHEPVSLSSTYYHELVDDGDPTTTDIYYQYVRLNDEMVNNGYYQLKEYDRNDNSGYYYWYMTQSRGNMVYAKFKCADPSRKTLADGSPNTDYYRYSIEIQMTSGYWPFETKYWAPVGYFMKEDMEILYKACKAGRITNGDITISGSSYTTNEVIESLFGGNYVMRDANEQAMWEKPYFEEVTLPGGAKEYVLQSPTLDNGFFIYGPMITYLKNSTATINVTEPTGSIAAGVHPVGEFIHTKFMLLYAVAEQGAPTN